MRHKIIAKVLVVNDIGDILCLTRSKSDKTRAGEWDFPGGNLDPDEALSAATIREMAEETGLRISDPQFAYATTDAYEEDRILTFLFFIVRMTGRPEITLSEEHEAYEWVTFDSLRLKPRFAPFNRALDFIVQYGFLE